VDVEPVHVLPKSPERLGELGNKTLIDRIVLVVKLVGPESLGQDHEELPYLRIGKRSQVTLIGGSHGVESLWIRGCLGHRLMGIRSGTSLRPVTTLPRFLAMPGREREERDNRVLTTR